jgi:hypothetical protein
LRSKDQGIPTPDDYDDTDEVDDDNLESTGVKVQNISNL